MFKYIDHSFFSLLLWYWIRYWESRNSTGTGNSHWISASVTWWFLIVIWTTYEGCATRAHCFKLVSRLVCCWTSGQSPFCPLESHSCCASGFHHSHSSLSSPAGYIFCSGSGVTIKPSLSPDILYPVRSVISIYFECLSPVWKGTY